MSRIWIRKGPRREVSYISSTFILSTTIAGSGQHPIDICQWIVLRVSLRYTDVYRLPIQFLLNGRPESQPIVVSMPVFCVRRWLNTTPNTDRTHDSSAPASTAITGRLTNVASMLIQRVWQLPNNNPAFCIHRLLRGNCYMGDNLSPVARKTTTQIHWPNCEIWLGHRLRRWANIIPTTPFKLWL